MQPPSTVAPPFRELWLGAHAVLLGVLCMLALIAVTTREDADAAESTLGIGVIRNGNMYSQASGYDRYSWVVVGLRDGAAAGALSTNSMQYMSAASVQQAWLTGVSYEQALASGWLLKDAAGQYVRTSYGAFLGDVGSAGYRQRWLDNVIPILRQQGNEGVFIDDVVSTAKSLGDLPAKYPTHDAWEEAMVSFIAAVGGALRNAGFYVAVNASSVIPGDGRTATGEHMARFNERLAGHVDGIMTEYWVQTPHGSPEPLKLRASGASSWTQHWDGWLNIQTRTQAAGADFFTVMYGTNSDVGVMRYGKASFLLEWDGSGGAFMYDSSGDPWHPEWTMDIGQPRAARYAVGVGWRRDYSGGTVLLNPSPGASQTFALGAPHVQANGTVVTSVTLGPVSALILKSQGTVAPAPAPPPPPPAPAPAPAPAPPPASTALPVVSGIAQQGITLTSSPGSWSNAPTGHLFQWKRCDASGSACTSIAGATAAQYTAAAVDVGRRLRAAVTASNAAGSSTATSNATAVVAAAPAAPAAPAPTAVPTASAEPTNTSAPVLAGVARVGSLLTSVPGTWSGEPTAYDYQWKRCEIAGDSCQPISGATASRYVLGDSDLYKTIRVRVTAVNAAGATTATSAQSRPIGPPLYPLPTSAPAPATPSTTSAAAPTNTSPPVLAGIARLGATLTSMPGRWSNSPSGFLYQWMRCDIQANACQPIGGATAPWYVLGAGDLFKTVRVRVRAVNPAGSTYATSQPSRPIGPPLL